MKTQGNRENILSPYALWGSCGAAMAKKKNLLRPSSFLLRRSPSNVQRRQGRVVSKDSSNHPPFCFRRQLPSKQKEMSCYRFRQRDCKCTWSNIHHLGKPCLIALETVAEKIRILCSHAKKIRIRNLCFRKIHFRERFQKAPLCGPSVFKKLRFGARAFSKSSGYVRIRVTVSMYPGSKSSVFEKTTVLMHVAFHHVFFLVKNAFSTSLKWGIWMFSGR